MQSWPVAVKNVKHQVPSYDLSASGPLYVGHRLACHGVADIHTVVTDVALEGFQVHADWGGLHPGALLHATVCV